MRPFWLWAAPVAFLVFATLRSHGTESSAHQPAGRVMAPGGPTAYATAHGTIITNSPEKARWAEARLGEAVANFERTFRVNPGRGVIVEMPFASYLDSLPESEKRYTLPWATRYFGAGDEPGTRSNGHHFDNDSGMRHELSHLFFTKKIVPNTRRFQYGGDAPDWLDEAAALSGETPRVKALRRDHFHNQVCQGRLIPLERFIRQQHPLFEAPLMQKIVSDHRAARNKGPAMMTIRVDQLGIGKHALLDFYAQSQAVAEFLAETFNEPAILHRIADEVRTTGNQLEPQPDRWVPAITRLDNRTLAARFKTWARTSTAAAGKACGDTTPLS